MPPPPPPPGVGPHATGNMTIRRAIQPAFKLPTVHWTAMKPNDTKDTIWYLMDDSKVIKDLDLASFEDVFKLAQQGPARKPSSKVANGDEKDGSEPPKKQVGISIDSGHIRATFGAAFQAIFCPFELGTELQL